MKKQYFLLVIVLGLIPSLISCTSKKSADEIQTRNDIFYLKNSEKPFSGLIYGDYKDSPKFKVQIKDGKIDGKIETWYENGQKKDEFECKSGTVYGVIKRWNKDGSQRYKGEVKDNCLNGPYEANFENGKLRVSIAFSDKKMNGKFTEYNPDGTKKAEGNISNNKRQGKWVFNNENGKTLLEGEYKDDFRTGRWFMYHPDCTDPFELKFINGVPIFSSWQLWEAVYHIYKKQSTTCPLVNYQELFSDICNFEGLKVIITDVFPSPDAYSFAAFNKATNSLAFLGVSSFAGIPTFHNVRVNFAPENIALFFETDLSIEERRQIFGYGRDYYTIGSIIGEIAGEVTDRILGMNEYRVMKLVNTRIYGMNDGIKDTILITDTSIVKPKGIFKEEMVAWVLGEEEPKDIVNSVINEIKNYIPPSEGSSSGTGNCDKFLQDYEAYVNEYIRILNEYKNNPNDVELMNKLTELLLQTAKWNDNAKDCDNDPNFREKFLKVQMRILAATNSQLNN